MGTYLKYRAPDNLRRRADKWLMKQSDKALGLWDEEDQTIERAKGERGSPDYLPLGVGRFKLSGGDEAECKRAIGVLIEGRKKWQIECFDVPSNVGDYVDAKRLPRLIDLPHWQEIWAKEAKEDARWNKARRKAITAARQKLGTGHGMLVRTWGDSWANVMFMHIAPTDSPRWIGVAYDQKGKHRVTTIREEHERFDLLRDDKGRGFLALPLMTLGEAGIRHGFAEVRNYLVEAHSIGLKMSPDAIMVGVYHALPEVFDFGDKLQQLAKPYGPYVRGVYTAHSGHRYYPTSNAVAQGEDGQLTWGKLGPHHAVELVRKNKRPKSDKSPPTFAERLWITYPALGQLINSNS